MEEKKGRTQTVSFSFPNVDLYYFVIRFAAEQKITKSAVHMLALRNLHDGNQLTLQDIMNKIDNLSLISISPEQSEQVKEEVVAAFNLGEGDLFG